MLKMFSANVATGSSPEHWDTSWEAGDMPQALADPRVCENDPNYALLMAKVRPDRLFLEGGCGQGQWVKYFHERGYRALGIDFAPRVIERFRRLVPGADARVGDIRHLPLADGEAHTYYSGGVVEHDESGPEPALAEARRVIAADGWFLCSVPDNTRLRDRLLFRRDVTHRPDLDPPMIVTRVGETRAEPPPAGMTFFQYAFGADEFVRRLEDAGFEVVDSFGYAATWGLMEVPYLGPLFQRLTSSRPATPVPPPANGSAAPAVPTPARRGALKELVIRAVIREDRTMPVAGPLIRFATEHFANMRMFVARPRG
ncbi:MAG TPA: class I SAM-dependent methyltransferase [Polyangia bacterium]|jgi:SAM-dependent methyltransferase